MTKKRVTYIINPKSGLGLKGIVEANIRILTNNDKIDANVVYTRCRGHAHQIARHLAGKADVVVAVGGDGTVNEVGTALIGSKTALGIIPSGSGNGLARALDIPLRAASAIEVINEMKTSDIDVIKISDHYSLNVAGVGFDAYISHHFAKKRIRGPLQYVNLIAREFPKYQAKDYKFDIDGHLLSRRAFLISFANSSQWGNNIHIAPGASIDDGEIDVCIISEFPNVAVPSLLFSLLSDSIDQNKYDEIIKAKRIALGNEEPLLGHVDGEPITIAPNSTVEICPLALKVVVPSDDFIQRHRFTPAAIKDIIQQGLPQLPIQLPIQLPKSRKGREKK